jgi:hypothetical protein
MTTPRKVGDSVTIGVLADPDLPTRLAHSLRADLPGELEQLLGEQVRWQVKVNGDPFEAMYPDNDQLIGRARDYVSETAWDLALCVTDLPLRDARGVLVAVIDPSDQVALISLPALGGWRLRHRLRELAVAIIAGLRARRTKSAGVPTRVHVRGLRASQQANGELHLLRRRPVGSICVLAGMVRANRPWQLVVGLSTALAGAMAGTSFGVLYSTIWTLAASLGPMRLAGITAAALTALSTWIIVGHSLWEHRAPDTDTGDDRYLALRNAGTVSTVVVGTIVFFFALYLLAVAAVALVVSPDYLATTLGRPSDLGDYLTIALMATVLGTVAGAVGSGLEDDVTVRKATYGYREQERRRIAEQRRRATEP